MSTAADPLPAQSDAGTFGSHPRGLRTLFFTELWERFSYYGMRALLVLYMAAPKEIGGLGFSTPEATAVYGWYTSLVYFSALPGGFLADRFLGQRRAVAIGGAVIAAGHFCLASTSMTLFYGGLGLIILGTGLLKPNISTMVGGLYPPGDRRRDGGFSIFYMGINLGAFIAPLACGFLAQHPWFIAKIQTWGFRADQSWHFGFAAAGVGMSWGLAQYLVGQRHLAHVGGAPADAKATRVDHSAARRLLVGARWRGAEAEANANATAEARAEAHPKAFTREEWMRLGAIAVLFFFATFFWSAFEQAGSSLNLFADQVTRNVAFGVAYPSSWYQSVNSLFIIGFAPVFAWAWIRLGAREPSSPAKFAWGLFWVGLSFVAVAAGAHLAQLSGGKASPWWLVGSYLFATWGELCLSPVGLSTVTKLAPAKVAALSMGVWFLSLAAGNKVGGWVAGHFDAKGSMSTLFLSVAAGAFLATVILAAITPWLKKLMSGVK